MFYTLIQSAMHQLDGRRPSSRSIREYSELIDIYGDDIIVPVEYTDVVVRYLESYALKVNVDKSFRNSHFRESCGADYYNGIRVNPIYARMYPPDNSRHWGAAELMSWNATADLFYLDGQWHVAQVIRDMLQRVTRRPISRSRSLGAGLAHLSLLFTTGLSFDKDLQCWRQKRTVFQPTKKKDEIDGNDLACLNKWALSTFSKHRGYGVGPSFGNRRPGLDGFYAVHSRSGSGEGRMDDSSDLPSTCVFSAERGSERRVSLGDPEADTNFCDGRLPYCEGSVQDEEAWLLHDLDGVHGDNGRTGDAVVVSTRQEADLEFLLRELEDRARDPLFYLDGRREGLDFLTSTKRGGFKSKRRWITLAG